MAESVIASFLGFVSIGLFTWLLGYRFTIFFRRLDGPSKAYVYIGSFFIALLLYGLIVFRWGLSSELEVSSIFTGVVVLVTILQIRQHLRRNRGHSPLGERDEGVRVLPAGRIYTLTAASVFFGAAFLLYQNLFYPRGWDNAMQHLFTESLIILGTLPPFELGTLAPPFFPRAYHMGAAVLTGLPLVEISPTLQAINLLALGSFPLAAFFFARVSFGPGRHTDFAMISSLFLGGLLILRGNLPMVASLHLLAIGLGSTLYLLRKRRAPDRHFLLLSLPLGVTLVAIHPVTAEIFAVFGLGVLLFAILTRAGRPSVLSALVPFLIVGAGALLYFSLYPEFFAGQVVFTQALLTTVPPNDSLTSSAIRVAVPEAILLFFTPFLIPPLIIGLLWSLRNKLYWVLSITLIGFALTFMQFLPLNGREVFVLFLPLTLLSGIGLSQLLAPLSVSRTRRSRYFFAFALAMITILPGIGLLYIGANPVFGTTVYIGDAEDEFAGLLREGNISDSRLIALNHPAVMRIGILSDNLVLVGDRRFYTFEEYRQVYFLVFEDDCNVILEQSSILKAEGILLFSDWSMTPAVLGNFSTCFGSTELIEHPEFTLLFWGPLS